MSPLNPYDLLPGGQQIGPKGTCRRATTARQQVVIAYESGLVRVPQ
jgi:hypothetical protein